MVSKQTWLFITSEDVSRGIPQGLLDVGDEVLVCLIERISGNYDSRIDQSMGHIRGNWERVGKLLPDTTNRLTAQSLYDAYDAALDEYWGFIEKIARGLRQKGVASVVGSLFQTHLNNHKGHTKTAGDKIIDATKFLDKQKAAKVAEWAAKTQSKLDDAIKAAKGQ